MSGWLKNLFKKRTLSGWFHVHFNQKKVYIHAEPPGRDSWEDSFRWEDIIRVVYQAEGPYLSDGIYVFTSQRAESYVIPVEADGGPEFWKQLIKLGHFDADLAKKVAGSTEGIFEWPPA
jgi:hypothetical protein